MTTRQQRINYCELTEEKDLNLSGCDITDLSEVRDLAHLTHLDLENNAIQDLSPLSDLINLTHLKLNNNLLTNIQPLIRILWYFCRKSSGCRNIAGFPKNF